MYHPPSKRKLLLQRLAVYSLMTVTTLVLLVVLVFVMLGYQFNKADGRIEQGGLVQFGTRPNGATVTIDGVNFGTRTPTKSTLTAGQHFFTMKYPGYDTWQKSVDVVAGSVLWVNYPRLIPTDLKPQSVTDFTTVIDTKVSPDRKLIAVKDNAQSPTVVLTDISADTVKKSTITIPADDLTQPQKKTDQSFAITDWDPSSRYLMVKHTYDTKKVEWLVIDTKDTAATKNVTKLLDVPASKLKFSNSNSKLLYALSDGDIKKIDLGATTLSGPLVRNVADFSLYDRSTIAYVTKHSAATKQRSVGYYTDGAKSPAIIKSYNDNGTVPFRIALGKYYNEDYVAVAYGSTIDISKGDLPASDSETPSSLKAVATMTIPKGASFLSINTDGRFVVAQHESTYSVYDLELSKMTNTKLKSGKTSKQELRWLDGYNVIDDQSGTVRLYEFDGTNQHDIMPVTPGFSVTLSQNGKYIYGFIKDAKKGFQLSRVQILLG